MRSTEIVNAFWDEVWNAHEPDAVDKFVADDVVIEAGGQEIAGKEKHQELDQAVSTTSTTCASTSSRPSRTRTAPASPPDGS